LVSILLPLEVIISRANICQALELAFGLLFLEGVGRLKERERERERGTTI